MKPLLSIVTGTVNRLAPLKRMIDSVRSQLPRGLSYEFIIVDGGSSDGTLQWCQEQSDIRLIKHGELRGAIRAFCDGAKAAQGDYVVLANDDVTFYRYGLLAAIRYLETIPTCGAVAFADNRESLLRGNGEDYRVLGMGATTPDGQKTMVPYAQIGMFRRELGELAGWWGADDEIMGQARVYGGDNYLSARLWEMGYSVDAVEGCRIRDYIQRDSLRDYNNTVSGNDSKLYYTRFPTVQLTSYLKSYPVTERPRFLHLPIYEQRYPAHLNKEYGMTDALGKIGLTLELDYLNDPDYDFVELVRAWQPDLMLTQIQGAGPKLTKHMLSAARQAAPNMVIVNWNGDAHEIGLTSPAVIDLLRFVDLQTTINAAVLPVYEKEGITAAYWQIGYKDPAKATGKVSHWDVLFQGNCYNPQRDDLVKTLISLRDWGMSVGIYGNCADASGNTHYDFARQAALNRQAKIVIGDTFPNTKAFVSNRMFQVLSQGGFLLQQHSEALEEYTGLKAGVHYVEWTDLNHLIEQCRYWIQPKREHARKKIAACGQEFVRANFSYDAQVQKLFSELLPAVERSYAVA